MTADQLDQSAEIIRERLDAVGVAAADVSVDDGAVIVEIRSLDDDETDRAVDVISEGGELRFRPVLQALGSVTGGDQPTGDTSSARPPATDDQPDATVTLDDRDGVSYQLGPALATGRIVESAQAENPQGQWVVRLTMRDGADGIDKFNEIASECHGRTPTCPSGQLAVVVDSVVESAPNIQEPSYDRDQIQISGSFDEAAATDLAARLRSGALPVPLDVQEVQRVTSTTSGSSG